MEPQQKRFFASTRGFTLVEIMIVVAVIGMLAGIAMVSVIKARTQAQINICISNLIHVETAKEQLALETGLTTGAVMTDASVNTYLKGGTTPRCPASGTYTYGLLGSNPVCTVSAHALADTYSPLVSSPPSSAPSSKPVL